MTDEPLNLSCGSCRAVRPFSGSPPVCSVCGWTYHPNPSKPLPGKFVPQTNQQSTGTVEYPDESEARLDEIEQRLDELESNHATEANHSAEGGVIGYGLGTCIAVVLSWSRNGSILWCILHGLLSWGYVIYFALTR